MSIRVLLAILILSLFNHKVPAPISFGVGSFVERHVALLESEMEIKSQKQAKKVLLQLQGELHKLELQYQKLNGVHKNAVEKKITETAVLWMSVLGEATHKGFVENNGVTVTISGTELKNPEQIGPVTLSVFKRAEELSKTEVKPETQTETLAKGNEIMTQNQTIAQIIAGAEAKFANIDKFSVAVEDIKSEMLAFEGETVTPELLKNVGEYLTALVKYNRTTDATGVSTLTAEKAVLNEAADQFYEGLENVDEETSAKFSKLLSDIVKNTDDEDKEGWTHKIWVGCKSGGSFVLDLAKGLVMYVYGGVIKILGTIRDIAGYTLGKMLSILDAATTKDFGRKTKEGVIMRAMKERVEAANATAA